MTRQEKGAFEELCVVETSKVFGCVPVFFPRLFFIFLYNFWIFNEKPPSILPLVPQENPREENHHQVRIQDCVVVCILYMKSRSWRAGEVYIHSPVPTKECGLKSGGRATESISWKCWGAMETTHSTIRHQCVTPVPFVYGAAVVHSSVSLRKGPGALCFP